MKGQEQKVCKLVKYLYGLKQLCNFACQESWNNNIYLMVYVYDPLMTRNNENYIAYINIPTYLKGFEMTYLGYVHYYLGIEVSQNLKFIFLSQKKYIGDMLNMLTCLIAIL